MKEVVVISGKGGTGKTSIAASLAVLSGQCVVADCDVDAADLHLVLSPQIAEHHDFYSGHEAVIRQDDCTACGLCRTHCRSGAIVPWSPVEEFEGFHRGVRYDCRNCDYCERSCPARIDDLIQTMGGPSPASQRVGFRIDPILCEGCGVCIQVCPGRAIDFPERLCGEWFISETRCGPMVHARLGVGAENSGKLVSIVRQHARRVADRQGIGLVIVDGAPGVGCPVIASITGASLALVVTEPTLSGEHDLKRVVELARHFNTQLCICINKWDVNPEMTARIEAFCREAVIPLAGRVRYDSGVTQAQLRSRTVVEIARDGVANDVQNVWSAVQACLQPVAQEIA